MLFCAIELWKRKKKNYYKILLIKSDFIELRLEYLRRNWLNILVYIERI